jgi:hypothetical protein
MELELEVVLKMDLVVQAVRILKGKEMFVQKEKQTRNVVTPPVPLVSVNMRLSPLLVVSSGRSNFGPGRSIQSSNQVA